MKSKDKEKEIEKAKEELILIYLGIKLRKESDVITNNIFKVQVLTLSDDDYINEINELKSTSILDIVEYIKNSIDVIVTLKIEEKENEYKSKKNDNAATDYETLLQKLEAAIRQHISYEHQIKLEYEKLLEKIEVIDLENKLLLYQNVSKIKYNNNIFYKQEKDKKQYEEKVKKLQNQLNTYKKEKSEFSQKENSYKNQLNLKQKEISKLQAQLKILNENTTTNHRNENSNNNSNLSMLVKSKGNSSFYTINKDELDHNNNQKKKNNEANNYYYQNQSNDNNYNNKNRTMSNIKPSRNNNYFTILNKPLNKKNNINSNISQQNTILNINSYLQKNFSSNSLRINSNSRKNYINSSNKKRNLKQNNNNSSLSITNNTYNMNKNNIMINVNPKNINSNMNLEKLKVQKKLYEYQKLIDQKLNELIKSKHFSGKNFKNTFHIRRNSSPNYKNSKRKNTSSTIAVEYYLKKGRKKSITPNTNSHLKKVNASRKHNNRQNMHSIKSRKNSQKNNSQSIKKDKNNINNMKQNLNKGNYYSKVEDDFIDNSIADKEENNNNGKINLSLRKFIFTKCSNSSSTNNKKY